eukprot:scaffold3707_cov228-Pinguiococcus_pyrenoidosus.AAC.4
MWRNPHVIARLPRKLFSVVGRRSRRKGRALLSTETARASEGRGASKEAEQRRKQASHCLTNWLRLCRRLLACLPACLESLGGGPGCLARCVPRRVPPVRRSLACMAACIIESTSNVIFAPVWRTNGWRRRKMKDSMEAPRLGTTSVGDRVPTLGHDASSDSSGSILHILDIPCGRLTQ